MERSLVTANYKEMQKKESVEDERECSHLVMGLVGVKMTFLVKKIVLYDFIY